MNLSNKLKKIADYLQSDYYAVIKFLEELLESTFDRSLKYYIQTSIKTIKEIPEIVNLMHLPLREQYLLVQENLKICNFTNIFYSLSPFKRKEQSKPFKNMRGYYLTKDLLSILEEICGSNYFQTENKPIPEGFLGEGAYGHILEETQGYVRKVVKIGEPFAKISKWLANQDFKFYQQIPFVRIYDAQLTQTGNTIENLITIKEDPEYIVTLILDKVTPFEAYSKKLREYGISRYIKYQEKIIKYNGNISLIDSNIQDDQNNRNIYPMPSSVNWQDFPLKQKSSKIIIYDLHSGNWGLYINKGTEEDPDRLVHIDLDFIKFN